MSDQSESVMDKVWNVFSSMKTGLILLGVIAIVSGIGTLIPQEALDPSGVKQVNTIWKTLGFTHLYSTIWFRLILGLLCVNLLVCSIQRIGGIYRITFKSMPPQSSKGIPQKIQTRILGNEKELREAVTDVLNRKGYHLTTNEQEGQWSFIAQKHKWGNWGSLITHIAFILLILGALLGSMIGFKGFFMAGEGETLSIQQIQVSKGNVKENFSVQINSAEDRLLANGDRDNWYTDLSILESGQEVARQTLSVNHPFSYKGVTFYQSSFAQGGKFTADVNGQKVPFVLQNQGGNYFEVPGTNLYFILAAMKADPKAPVVLYQAYQGYSSQPVAMGQMNLGQSSKVNDTVSLTFDGLTSFTGLQVKKDPGVNWVWLGCAFLMLGLVLSFYWRPYTVTGILEMKKESGLLMGAVRGKLAVGTQDEFKRIEADIKERLTADSSAVTR
ncbi:cytochrome c biogenesis protein ResB [Desulfitobacterium metallireducens]|uniref:Cytochrome C biogenesis protein ResB n=1 Tax=Desulfitobacterium metallireducens DSM 15288 TaxID=871968 RepID=W0E8P7_9FIRM|nr:cytochrome c biogenesis protein ResB [Desulfitobacterium metallireducens]AHF07210.1 cytochrome C biogenesis protein ResB [Desulfitobacterium metallireducens DSM 15288]